MAAYRRRVYDSRHLQADGCQEPGSASEPYARQSSMGYLYLYSPYHLIPQCIARWLSSGRLLHAVLFTEFFVSDFIAKDICFYYYYFVRK